ncbi:hypothetical protein [Halalkalibaculum sp. DA384]|uniref:hypothetical protein n=1 Tax=Halalkalibaculum sp. DA384 TaxID=3373606 RepID=UPI00375504A5
MSQEKSTDGEESSAGLLNTKLVMTSSALFLGVLGVPTSFFAPEILEYYGTPPEGVEVLFVKAAGAMYLGFAILNWMARGNIIGGIYSRPVALGNFFHFAVVAVMLLKRLIVESHSAIIVIAAVAYTVFACCFGYIISTGGQSCG